MRTEQIEPIPAFAKADHTVDGLSERMRSLFEARSSKNHKVQALTLINHALKAPPNQIPPLISPPIALMLQATRLDVPPDQAEETINLLAQLIVSAEQNPNEAELHRRQTEALNAQLWDTALAALGAARESGLGVPWSRWALDATETNLQGIMDLQRTRHRATNPHFFGLALHLQAVNQLNHRLDCPESLRDLLRAGLNASAASHATLINYRNPDITPNLLQCLHEMAALDPNVQTEPDSSPEP